MLALAFLSTVAFAGCAEQSEDNAAEVALETAGADREDVEKQQAPEMPAPPEPAAAPAPLSPAQQRVPDELRQKVASLMVVGVANYDQARFALDQGVGGLIIPSWADPALLTEPGRDINALRAQYHLSLIHI